MKRRVQDPSRQCERCGSTTRLGFILCGKCLADDEAENERQEMIEVAESADTLEELKKVTLYLLRMNR